MLRDQRAVGWECMQQWAGVSMTAVAVMWRGGRRPVSPVYRRRCRLVATQHGRRRGWRDHTLTATTRAMTRREATELRSRRHRLHRRATISRGRADRPSAAPHTTMSLCRARSVMGCICLHVLPLRRPPPSLPLVLTLWATGEAAAVGPPARLSHKITGGRSLLRGALGSPLPPPPACQTQLGCVRLLAA